MSTRLFFAGDVVINREWSCPLLSNELHTIVENADLSVCNFEAPIACFGQRKAKKIGPSISQNSSIIGILKEEGFNLISAANNHIMDYGVEGLKTTLNCCHEKSMNIIGAGLSKKEAYAPFVMEKEGIRIGIISVAEKGFGVTIRDNSAGFAWFGDDLFEEVLDRLINDCDYVIVICHGGAEKWDLPLPEYRKLYKSWIDRGVAAVIGHHPHVPQGFELYKGCGIYYSLGNFAFDKGIGIQDPKTICAAITIEKNSINFGIIPTEFTEQGVTICNNEAFQKQIRRCNDYLLEPLYTNTINDLCVKAYNEKYKRYYGSVVHIYSGDVKQICKTMIYRLLKRKSFSDEWLYHNVAIETHYWICRRALDIIINTDL